MAYSRIHSLNTFLIELLKKGGRRIQNDGQSLPTGEDAVVKTTVHRPQSTTHSAKRNQDGGGVAINGVLSTSNEWTSVTSVLQFDVHFVHSKVVHTGIVRSIAFCFVFNSV